MSGVFTIPPDLCFVTALAKGLWARVGGDPLRLADGIIYLPTRRSCRALRDAFLRTTGGNAALLPRMRPLGDVDEGDFDFTGVAALDDVPPAITPLRRQMLLTALVQKKDPSLPIDQAAALAQALAALLDQAQTEGKSFDALETLAPNEYAQHWQETLTFLKIVTEAWPSILAHEGCIDPAERRRLVLQAQAERWRDDPPPYPVIVAGSTGSVPAAGELMGVVASLPKGEVILPGLDLDLDEESWQEADSTHPQFTMKKWLEGVKLTRADVRPWEGLSGPHTARVRLLREAMRPAEVTEKWRELTPADVPAEATRGLELLELDHHREEADLIALRLRAALEEEGQTAALITPDRALAKRVASALARWGIQVDDSAGAPLSTYPVGTFLLDLLAAASPSVSPVHCLTLLKHPLMAAGVDPAKCRAQARSAEIALWRGVRPADGWAGAAHALLADQPELGKWLTGLADLFAPISQSWNEVRPLSQRLTDHLALAEALATTPQATGAARLWRGEAGEAAVAWLADWREAAIDFPPLDGEAYARFFRALIGQVSVRPAYGTHPRLALLGPLEARLLHHDLIVLGGLNEGTWPPAPPVDPWMSRPMKHDFGLPMPERRVGLSAHDFVQLAAASRVVMTRSGRVGGTPTVPSRFLLQLDAVLQASGREGRLAAETPWRSWVRALDMAAQTTPMPPPAPTPAVELRPSRLSVTEIGTWKRNPYAIYAKRVLGLRKLDDIDADVTAADKGEMIHAALENFVRREIDGGLDDLLATLLEEGRKAFAPFKDRPQVFAFWWPRFERVALWVVDDLKARRKDGVRPLLVEAKGQIGFRGGTFVLTGRVDRVDVDGENRLVIIDYKTGGVPTNKDVFLGMEPQLPLLSLIGREAGFDGMSPATAAQLVYWKLTGGEEAVEISAFKGDLEGLITCARDGLEALIEKFADPLTPYQAVPKPRYAPRYDDYAHLARLAEWGRVRGGDA